MKLRIIILSIALLPSQSYTKTPHSIVLTFERYPTYESVTDVTQDHNVTAVVKTKKKIIQDSDSIKKQSKRIKKTINVAGIPIFYYGSLTYSPHNGIIMLPRMHETPQFYILIAAEKNKAPIEPIFMVKNTIHHFKLSPTATYELFLVTKKYDETTKSNFWHVEKKPTPTDLQLPIETIIIIGYPSDIYLPEGISLTNDSAQSVLPVMYVKHDERQAENALAALEVSYLFKLIEPVKK